MKKLELYLLALLACLVSCSPDTLGGGDYEEPEEARKLIVCGYVYNSETSAIIDGARVEIRGVDYCYTDGNGAYEIHEVLEGRYRVEVSCMGYKTLSLDMTISADEDPVYYYKDFYLTERSGDSGNDGSNPGDNNDDNIGDNGGNEDDSGDDNNPVEEEDYSEAEINTDLANLDVNLVSCLRKGNNVELTYTLTNNSSYGNMGITINNVNTFAQKTFISDDLGNQYDNTSVKISLGGKDWGYGNNIEGTLLTDIPSKCVITVKNVDDSAKYMTYYIYTSTALPGSVNYSDDVVLKNVKIH